MPDSRPDMRQRALFVTSNAACRWNKMLLAELKVDIPRRTKCHVGVTSLSVKSLRTVCAAIFPPPLHIT